MTDQGRTKPASAELPVMGANSVERRGLFAAAWAAIAALVFAKTTEPVAAAAGMQFQDTGGGGFVNNSAGGPSAIYSNTGYTSTSSTFVGYAFQGAATAGICGINGSGNGNSPIACGVYGTQNKVTGASNTAGVYGENSSTTGIGVLGRSGDASNLRNGVGVQGESAGGIGVRGVIPGTSNANGIAVYGLNQSAYAGPGPGAGGFGVYGASSNGHGLVGAVGAAGAAAVVGATNGVVNAYAAAFYGPVIVSGALTVFGAKSAAVPHPDGSNRLLYCVESPESWFEDFGTATLDCGEVRVTIDPDFAAIADTSEYHVFLSVYEQQNDLIISERTPHTFRVRSTDTRSQSAFSYRIVAKRKDIEGARLARVTIPPEPQLPTPPYMPENAAPSDVIRRSTPQ